MTEFIDWFLQLPWLLIIGWLTTAGTFYWKLTTDTRYSRYRETVAYIEKREAALRDRWKKISDKNVDIADKSDDVYWFFAQLELISLLVNNKAFDAEIVYNFWWRYFDEPLKIHEINTWLLLERASDAHLFEHYLALCKKWSRRIDKEQGNPS